MNFRSFLAVLLTGILAIGAVFAARHPRAATIITSLPYLITKPGVYKLAADLTYPLQEKENGPEGVALIEIGASNVTLDFQGHSIFGNANAGTGLYGVHAFEQENITIRNGGIARCYVGILLHGDLSPGSHNINHRVENMLVTHGYHVGVDLFGARSCEINHCRISFIGPSKRIPFACGIISTGDAIRLSGNQISNVVPREGDGFGIFCNGSPGVFAVGNTVSNSIFGISAGMYKDNLTSGCKVAVGGGVDAGGNH